MQILSEKQWWMIISTTIVKILRNIINFEFKFFTKQPECIYDIQVLDTILLTDSYNVIERVA